MAVDTPPHPLDPLSLEESNTIRKVVLEAQSSDAVVKFRTIALEEPPKEELVRFLDLEHSGSLTSASPRPARIAKVQFDVIRTPSDHDYVESWIDTRNNTEVQQKIVDKAHQAGIIIHEFKDFSEAIHDAPLFRKAVAEFEIPEGFVVQIDPWPYGGPDADEQAPRYIQGLCFARDGRNNNADSNHYAYPIPIIPVMDIYSREVIRIDRLATGGKEDGFKTGTHKKNVISHCIPGEYVPELLSTPLRTDVKPLNVLQPDGPSFHVDGNLIQWQKWRFRLGFNPREGATLHDIRYDGRSVLHRCSLSEMCVPYGDPRPPFQRKQAFDFGDAGAGRAANNLALGCDCLGVIKYFDAVALEADGTATTCKNVVCLHEQDNGIGWKHTNYRTERAVVTRLRELVVQFIITLANYEYIFAYKFDQAGGFTIETRATGIVSVVNIDEGKTSAYGNVVSGGALAQNHQHLFCVRIDPAVDGHQNTVVREESLPMEICQETNPYGTGYEVRQTSVSKSQYFDASPFTNLTVKITNPSKINPVSKKPVAYKFIPSPTQLLLAHPDSIMAKRAQFAQHHVWVTKYKDGEYYAGGEFTNQSQKEINGVGDAVARGESVDNEDIVVWHTFGLTHNPRVEDWPVMPVEIHQIHLKPSDFFTANPALDVPGVKNNSSVLVDSNNVVNGTSIPNGTNRANGANGDSCCKSSKDQSAAAIHLQGSGPDYDPNA